MDMNNEDQVSYVSTLIDKVDIDTLTGRSLSSIIHPLPLRRVTFWFSGGKERLQAANTHC